MIKIRIEGIKEEIEKFIETMQHDDKYTIFNISNLYPNYGRSLYYRCYLDVAVNQDEEEK